MQALVKILPPLGPEALKTIATMGLILDLFDLG